MKLSMQGGRKTRGRMFALLLFLLANVFRAQPGPSADQKQISRLLAAICDHSIKPLDALDPLMDSHKRARSLERLDDPAYQMRLIPEAEIQINADGTATVPARVRFKNENNELAAQSTLRFVKRGPAWYFADFSFLEFPTFLIVFLVLGLLIGISFASVVLYLRWKLLKQGKLSWSNGLKIFVPVFWPSLYKEISSR